MKRTLSAIAALAGMALVGQAHADVVGIKIGGPGTGISGFVVLSYGPASDSKYPGQGFEITAVSGTFTDTNVSIVDAPITSLVKISPTDTLDTDPPNLLAPHDFSHFAATGLPSENRGFITYDNLFWPDGAPPTASAFDGAGGFLDIYGLMFTIGGATPAAVDLFNNGVSPTTGVNYGGFGAAVVTLATVSTPSAKLDYVAGGVTATAPEASTWMMMILGFASLGVAGYRQSRRAKSVAA
jgi:hypothetical protein